MVQATTDPAKTVAPGAGTDAGSLPNLYLDFSKNRDQLRAS